MRSIEMQPSALIITGVTRGRGRAMADGFDNLGYTMFGCARTTDQIKELSRKYQRHEFEVVDVASDAHVKAWAKRPLIQYGLPDFVINDAAVINPRVPLWKVGNGAFYDAIDTNIKGVVNVIRHFTPYMTRRKC